jgi:pyrrolidone-carboxylate peptidase
VDTVEEQRARQPIAAEILAGSPLRALVDRVAAGTFDDPATLGHDLWREAVRIGGDDRPLYWARLRVSATLREQGVDPASFELAARGISGDEPADLVITGFDPYRLDEDVRRGNPSGAIALALAGRMVAGRRIRTMIFPVRYADFDDGLVERALTRYAGRVQWIVTVSQGRPDQFDLEVWNGRRRSASRHDNAGQFGGGSDTHPVVPPGMPEGPEFVAATLPWEVLAKATDGAYPVRVNHTLTQLVPGGLPHDDTRPNPDALAVAGSGGGFLSNEIAYRNTRLLAAQADPTATLGGHVHTPMLPTPPDDELTGTEMTQARADIVAQFGDLLRAGLSGADD